MASGNETGGAGKETRRDTLHPENDKQPLLHWQSGINETRQKSKYYICRKSSKEQRSEKKTERHVQRDVQQCPGIIWTEKNNPQRPPLPREVIICAATLCSVQRRKMKPDIEAAAVHSV